MRRADSLEKTLMLKVKLQYFGHLLLRTHSLEKTLMLGKIEGRQSKGQDKIQVVTKANLFSVFRARK